MKMQPEAVYDARTLGLPRMTLLGVQHMFAMFGATILVPILTGLSPSATLLWACCGTLLFHFLTKRMVPAFLGSSFAYLAAYFALSGLAVGSLVGIILNAILPGKDYEFSETAPTIKDADRFGGIKQS